MSTLSLNTSITSAHKDDFYSTTGEHWIKVNNVYGNYFSDSNCPGGNPMDFYVRIHDTDIWKYIGSGNDFNYYSPPCYQKCLWDTIYVRYYNFDNPNDPDTGKYIDKIAVTYLGLRNESFINRCKISIKTVDKNNLPLSGVKILDLNIPTTDNYNYIVSTVEDMELCDPSECKFTDIASELMICNTEVSLMQTQRQNDCILIETKGIPTKLTWTISTPGIYIGGSVHYQYWNGVDWIYFPEAGVIDETNGFRNSDTKNVILPVVSDWKKRTYGTNLDMLYMCRAIFDSDITVTTVPKASCFRWSGSYETVTDSSGLFKFPVFTSGGYSTNIPGTLTGYIPISGNGILTIPEATSDKDIIIILAKSDLSNNITCPTIVYKNQTKDILVTSTVSNGIILNTLTISSPKTETVIFNPTSGTNIPISYTFNEEDLYKIQLSSKDDGGNVLGKTCYITVTKSPSCNLLTDQFSCELNECFWTGTNCVSTNPNNELLNIYDSIINKTECISDECVKVLDLNNDGIIDINDKNLVPSLTYDETISKILSYQICKELNPCDKSKISTLVYVAIGTIISYVGYKTLTKK